MKITLLNKFQEELNHIRDYLKHIEYVNNVIGYSGLENDSDEIKILLKTLKEHSKFFRIARKRFEYKATIISLYGLLEKYIEAWIKEYLDSLSRLVPNYNLIDEKIRENHFELSLKLINTMTTRESAKYQHITKEEVLNNLNSCIVSPNNYRINAEAFVLSSGNLKHAKISDLFKNLNIDLNAKLLDNKSLNNQIGLSKEKNAQTEKDVLYEKINDLVERRNEIAHGAENIDNLLDISELKAYIDFLEVYGKAIFEGLREELIKQESVHTFQKIEKVIKIFNNQILAFEIESYRIHIGDTIIIQTPEGKFDKKQILDIQLDGKSYPALQISEKKKIAVRLEAKIKENQTFYIKKIG